MDTKPKAVYKPKKGFSYYFLILIGLGISIAGGYVIFLAFKNLYPDLLKIIFGSILIILGLYILYFNLNRKSIIIYPDALLLKPNLFFKETRIPLKEIKSWCEINKTNKGSSWEELTLITDTKTYCIESYNYDSYYSFKYTITQNIPRNIEFEKKLEAGIILKISAFLIAIGILFIGILASNLKSGQQTLKAEDFTQIKQVITSEVKIKKGSKGARSIHLKFEKYPEFDFKISGDAYDAMYAKEFVRNVSTYDTVSVLVSKDDYDKKLVKTKPLSFFDKTIKYYSIRLYGVATKNQNYLSLSDYFIETKDRQRRNGWLLGVIGGILMLIGIFGILKRKKIAAA